MTTTTLAAAAANVIVLSADEHAFIIAQRNAGFVPEPVMPVAEKPLSKGAIFLDKIEGLNGTSLNRFRGAYPAMIVNTAKGRRGVFWVGVKNGALRVGTCKITETTGWLYKPNKFDGAFFQDATDLVPLNS